MKQNWRTETQTRTHVAVAAGPAPQILDAAWHYDEGAVRVEFIDGNERRTVCCFDHRHGTDTPGRIFIGHGLRAAGVRPATRLEELRIVTVLRNAVEAMYSPDVRRNLLSKRYDTEIPAAEYSAWLVLRELWRRGEF